MSSSEKKGKVFYGWWIVVVCSFLSIYGSGIFYYGFGTFVKPIAKALGWSMALISGAFSFYRLEAGIASLIVGFLLDRIGPRRLVFAGGIIMGGGSICLSQGTTALPFCAAIIIISMDWSAFAGSAVSNPLRAIAIYAATIGLAGLLIPVVSYLIGKWFVKKRGSLLTV